MFAILFWCLVDCFFLPFIVYYFILICIGNSLCTVSFGSWFSKPETQKPGSLQGASWSCSDVVFTGTSRGSECVVCCFFWLQTSSNKNLDLSRSCYDCDSADTKPEPIQQLHTNVHQVFYTVECSANLYNTKHQLS